MKRIVLKMMVMGYLLIIGSTISFGKDNKDNNIGWRKMYQRIDGFNEYEKAFKSGDTSFRLCNKFPFFCVPNQPCDGVITCAFSKQRTTLEARLDDLIKAIKANTKQTKHQTKIIKQEVLAYKRLLERVKKESLSLKEALFLSKKIKDSESLGVTADITGKGK